MAMAALATTAHQVAACPIGIRGGPARSGGPCGHVSSVQSLQQRIQHPRRDVSSDRGQSGAHPGERPGRQSDGAALGRTLRLGHALRSRRDLTALVVRFADPQDSALRADLETGLTLGAPFQVNLGDVIQDAQRAELARGHTRTGAGTSLTINPDHDRLARTLPVQEPQSARQAPFGIHGRDAAPRIGPFLRRPCPNGRLWSDERWPRVCPP